MGGPVDDPFTGSPKTVAQGVAEESDTSRTLHNTLGSLKAFLVTGFADMSRE